MWRWVLIVLVFVAFGCEEERPRGGADAGLARDADPSPEDAATAEDAAAPEDAAPEDAGEADAEPLDAGEPDALTEDATPLDTGAADAEPLDTGAPDAVAADASAPDADAPDATPVDMGVPDTGPPDLGVPDTGPPDLGVPDTGVVDAGPPDTGVIDAGPPDTGLPPPVTCTEPGLVTRVIRDTASSGTPDTYFFDVNPGDPFCASITGGGGTWGVTMSNGTSSGIYCNNTPNCRVRIRAGDPTVLVTALTNNIGAYTLTVQYIPR